MSEVHATVPMEATQPTAMPLSVASLPLASLPLASLPLASRPLARRAATSFSETAATSSATAATSSAATAGLNIAGLNTEAAAAAAKATNHRRHLVHDARNWLTVLRIHCDLLEQTGAVAEPYRGWLQELSTNIDRGQGILATLLAAEAPASAAGAAAVQLSGPAAFATGQQLPSGTHTATDPATDIAAGTATAREAEIRNEAGGPCNPNESGSNDLSNNEFSNRTFSSTKSYDTELRQNPLRNQAMRNPAMHNLALRHTHTTTNTPEPALANRAQALSPTQASPTAGTLLHVSERKPRTMFSTISMPVKQFPPSVPDRSGMLHLLVVDDETPIRTAAAEIARNRGFSVHTAENTAGARAALEAHMADIVLLDLRLPGGGGLALLDEIRTLYPETVVIVMTAYATVSSAVEAMRSGASEYLTKPFTMDELGEVLERGAERRHFDLESRRLREKLRTPEGFGTLIGRSPEMERMYRILAKVATTTHPVLILGESGTGKEMVARTIHYNGPHASQPFIPVDCGSLVPTLIESELFGYVKGAFTGANRSKDGLLATAEDGTVFLDEIGELPLDLQSKLLRALQEKEIRPVGSTQRIPIRARILAATNRDLPTMVEQGRFRKDLYFRLNVVNVKLPPLRDRRADIPILAAHFLDKLRRENNRDYSLSDDVLRVMNTYDWPGNVRELENMIERACALSSGPLLHLGDLPTQLQEHRLQTQRLHQATQAAEESQAALDEEAHLGDAGILTIAEMEKQAILNTIRQLNGDKLTAAKLLGIGKTTLYRKLKEYGIVDIELQ